MDNVIISPSHLDQMYQGQQYSLDKYLGCTFILINLRCKCIGSDIAKWLPFNYKVACVYREEGDNFKSNKRWTFIGPKNTHTFKATHVFSDQVRTLDYASGHYSNVHEY